MIAAVATTRDEEDVIEASIRNLLAQGVGLVLIADASTDGTRAILWRLGRETGRVQWSVDTDRHHEQQEWIDALAATAHDEGAEWIVPFDADEFWFGLDLLNALDPAVTVAQATLWNHRDWENKIIPVERLPKVAYRWSPEARIAPGNHDVSLAGAREMVLEVRHLPYRSEEQFIRKVQERNRTLSPAARERGDGTHHTRLEGLDADELRAAYAEWCSQPTVYDPIPCSR
jgi:hypothetical protein